MSAVADLTRRAVKVASVVTDRVGGPLPGPRLLIYHQVGAGTGLEMEVTTAAFLEQLDWLAGNGSVVGLDEALARRDDADSSSLYVLTFDDGYADVYHNAYPLLLERGMAFTIYLTTGHVESRQPLRDDGRCEPMTWDQVAEMQESGLLTLGAHTHRHLDLRHLTELEVGAEVDISNELIERRLGEFPRHFTYPWGYWSPQADRVVRRVYQTATLGSGPAINGDTDLFLLNRLPVQLTDGIGFFRRRMIGGLRLEDRLRRSLRGYRGP